MGGEPTGTRPFVRSSLRCLAKRLGRGSPTTVGRLLRGLGFSPRVNIKRFTGPPHPDRDRQFRYLRRQRHQFQRAGCPALSVDAKKKELISNFRNAGRKWSRCPEQVYTHDFPHDAQCRAVPYGIYDAARQAGHVCVGTSAETSEFAVDALRQWWNTQGRHHYPAAERLFIEADAGGSNGYRRRLWKRELQRWAGQPLRTLDTMLGLIRGTRTRTGLRVTARLNPKRYEHNIQVTDNEIAQLNIQRHPTCPQWNYTIRPRL